MSLQVQKDPQAELDYGVDWSRWLNQFDDIIATSTWNVEPSGDLTITQSSNDDTKTTVWLSGGEVGKRYKVVNTIMTDQGRETQRTLLIEIQNK